MDRLDRFDLAYAKFCERVVTYAVGGLMLLAVLAVTTNVLGRYLFRQPIMGLYHYIGFMLVPMTFWSFAFGWYKRGTFVTVNILPTRLKGKAQWVNQFLIFLLVAILFGGAMLWGSAAATWIAYTTDQVTGSIGFLSPTWPWKLTMVIGMVMFDIRISLDIIQMVRKREIIPFFRA